MNYFFQVIKGNIQLQYKNYFFNKAIYMSLFIWPLIHFTNAYYSYKPFSTEVLFRKTGLETYEELYVYLLIGFVSMMFFWSLMQAAWMSAYTFRLAGTLELLYMSPASRVATLLGNAIGSLVGSVWMLIVFTGIVFRVYYKSLNIELGSLVIGILLLIVLAISWGVFLNSLFLMSRDGGFLYTILEAPMEIFSGVKIPFHVMPFWAKAIGFMFPLTYIITVLRGCILFGHDIYSLFSSILICCIMSLVLVALAYVILVLGERNAKINGTATLF